jgi:hypothetical protein
VSFFFTPQFYKYFTKSQRFAASRIKIISTEEKKSCMCFAYKHESADFISFYEKIGSLNIIEWERVLLIFLGSVDFFFANFKRIMRVEKMEKLQKE